MPAEVDLDERLRQVACALAPAVPGEPDVDHRDLHALAAHSRLVPEGCARRGDALSPHRIGHGSHRLADDADVSTARERGQRLRRDERLDHTSVGRLDPSSLPNDHRLGSSGALSQELHPDTAVARAASWESSFATLTGCTAGWSSSRARPRVPAPLAAAPAAASSRTTSPTRPLRTQPPSRSHLRDSCKRRSSP